MHPIHYLALGDSISIDDYTGVVAGGAASQFAQLLEAVGFDNRTRDGSTTSNVLVELDRHFEPPDVVTLTVCGNDLLVGLSALIGPEPDWHSRVAAILERYEMILTRLRHLPCPVIVNTVYDPTDGADDLAALIGLPTQVREPFDAVNSHIRSCCGGNIRLCDLETLFAGHGNWASDPWITGFIEPNLAGATAIAKRWMEIYSS